jgi:hypothetical protein
MKRDKTIPANPVIEYWGECDSNIFHVPILEDRKQPAKNSNDLPRKVYNMKNELSPIREPKGRKPSIQAMEKPVKARIILNLKYGMVRFLK